MLSVEAKNISKSFSGVKALSNVSVAIKKGEIHAIVGENGAGKSTLMKILGGSYSSDTGEIFINGKKTEINSIADSLEAGVSVIYQELNLMPELTVAENIFVNSLPSNKLGILDIKKLNAQAKELIDSLEIDIKPTTIVSNLSVSQRQMIEIVKALSHKSDIIIMDEPTASLNNQEVDILYGIIKRLKADGKTIIYISHRLKEIFDLADSVTILRDGCFVASAGIEELDHNALVRLMVGRDVSQLYTYVENELGKEILKVDEITHGNIFKNFSFTVKEGEILGMAGLMGCGHEEIVKSIYGLVPLDSGKILLNSKEVTIKTPTDAIKNRIGFVTEDRKDAGIFALMSVRENLTMNILKSLTKLGLISSKKEDELLAKYTKDMNMKYSDHTQRIMSLSGGNQQKFVLARALLADCRVLIMLEPTRGIDVGAKSEIYSLLSDLSREGLAIIVISSELPEIITMCHRSLVVFQGEVTGNIVHDEMNEELIMQCATGTTKYFSEGVAL